MSTSLITFQNVQLGYGRKKILSNLSFTIHAADFLGIVGPNGSGKTTLLRALLGILRPQNGEILFTAEGNRPLRKGYVPQRDAIDPIMPFTVHDVVLMGLYGTLGLFRHPSKRDKEIVTESLRHVDILDLADVPFRDLSGGQKQRTLIARALAGEPDVLVLDEPTNGMDLSSRTAILELVKKLHREDRLTVIMVSHLLSDVANYVQRIAVVEEGKFQIGTTAEILTEENLIKLYDLPIRVETVHGSTVVLVGGEHD